MQKETLALLSGLLRTAWDTQQEPFAVTPPMMRDWSAVVRASPIQVPSDTDAAAKGDAFLKYLRGTVSHSLRTFVASSRGSHRDGTAADDDGSRHVRDSLGDWRSEAEGVTSRPSLRAAGSASEGGTRAAHLAIHYGFAEEELDFIVNYDTRLRWNGFGGQVKGWMGRDKTPERMGHDRGEAEKV